MTIKELEERLNPGAILSLADKGQLKKIAADQYRINPCPICGHKDHFTIYTSTNSYSTFADCSGKGNGGGVYRYLVDITGLSEDQAREKLQEMAGYIPDEQKKEPAPAKVESKEPEQELEKSQNYTTLISKVYDTQLPETKAYFVNRGIGQNLIEKYKLSVFKDQDGRRAMLPVWRDDNVIYFTKRELDGQQPKYKNATGQAQLFNLPELDNARAGDTVVITEGIFDALSVEENTGIKAVALGGVNHYSRIEQAIKEAQDRGVTVLSAFDNDDAGRQLTDTAGLPAVEIPDQYKDINDWSISAPFEVNEAIIQTIEQQQRPEAASHYLNHEFLNAIESFKQYQGRETGFNNLDHYLGGFFPGLYVIGGVSSVGKTTFTHQLGDQLAERGDHVLYFSLEQSKFEMISKSIARETAKIELEQGAKIENLYEAVSNINVRSGRSSEIVGKAIQNYQPAAERMNIIEGNFMITVESIKQHVQRYIARNGAKPVVIIDYLQILPGDPRMSDKQRIDTNVTELKRLSRDQDIAVIVVSSLNRASYTAPVTFEAFKESGGIEYTADVVIGLQLEAVKDRIRGGEDSDKQELLRKAKEEIPRKIELVCLKNRNGRTFSCSFKYNQVFDYYASNTVAAGTQRRL